MLSRLPRLTRRRLSVAVLALLVGVVSSGSQAVRPSAVVDTGQLLEDVRILAADDMEGRRFGTQGGERARRYVLERYRASGIPALVPGYEQPLSERDGQGTRRGANVLGVVRGTTNPGRYIVVTAHFDHIGVRDGVVYNGADDNASGVAALLAIGAHLQAKPLRASVVLAALDGEEGGLRGARAFLARPPVPLTAIVVNVNLDMLGRAQDERLFAAGASHYPVLRAPLEAVAARAPVRLLLGHDDPNQAGVEDWTRDSDHYAFHQAGIPFVYLGVEDFAQHHQPTDDYATLTHDFFVRAVETALLVVTELDAHLGTAVRAR
jgi:Zn-dependent M28 family amino/carboxypeptidase